MTLLVFIVRQPIQHVGQTFSKGKNDCPAKNFKPDPERLYNKENKLKLESVTGVNPSIGSLYNLSANDE